MEKTEEKKEQFTLFWSGDNVSTGFLSKYYANELDTIKEQNMLLGEFNGKGKYSFSQETKKALIAVKKAVEEKIENSYYIIAKTFKNTFSFKMKIFDVEDDSLLAANLYLIEVVDDERFKKPLKTFIAQYIDKKNDEFINKAKYVFNITTQGDFLDYEKKENETIIEPVLPKFRAKNVDMLEIAAESFVKEIIEELKKTKEGKKILKEFFDKAGDEGKKLLNNDEKEKPNFLELKKVLDIVVENNKGFEKLVESNPQIEKSIQKYNEAVDAEKEFAKNIELSHNEFKELKNKEEKKEEKKEDKGKDSASTKGNSSKSSGNTGKSNGSKSDKKDKGNKSKGGKDKKDKGKKDDKKKKVFAIDPGFQTIKIKTADEILKAQKQTNKKPTEKKPVQKIIKKPEIEPVVIAQKPPEVATQKPQVKKEKNDILNSFIEDYEKEMVLADMLDDERTEKNDIQIDVAEVTMQEKKIYEDFTIPEEEAEKETLEFLNGEGKKKKKKLSVDKNELIF